MEWENGSVRNFNHSRQLEGYWIINDLEEMTTLKVHPPLPWARKRKKSFQLPTSRGPHLTFDFIAIRKETNTFRFAITYCLSVQPHVVLAVILYDRFWHWFSFTNNKPHLLSKGDSLQCILWKKFKFFREINPKLSFWLQTRPKTKITRNWQN